LKALDCPRRSSLSGPGLLAALHRAFVPARFGCRVGRETFFRIVANLAACPGPTRPSFGGRLRAPRLVNLFELLCVNRALGRRQLVDLRSWGTSTGRARLQMMRSSSQMVGLGSCVDSLRPFIDGDPIYDRFIGRTFTWDTLQ